MAAAERGGGGGGGVDDEVAELWPAARRGDAAALERLSRLAKARDSHAATAAAVEARGGSGALTRVLSLGGDAADAAAALLGALAAPPKSEERRELSEFRLAAGVSVRLYELSYDHVDAEGSRVWTAALVLANRTAAREPDVRGRSVLELGAGCGVNGLAAAKLGASRVVITDFLPDMLANLRDNVALLDGPAAGVCEVSHLDWASDEEPAAEAFDVILAADCVLGAYHSVELLPSVVKRRLAPGGVALFSLRVRQNEHRVEAFVAALERAGLEVVRDAVSEEEASLAGAGCDASQAALSVLTAGTGLEVLTATLPGGGARE